MARKDHLITVQEDSKLSKKFLSRNNAIVFQSQVPTIAQQINGIGAASKTPDEVKDTKFPVLNPIDEIGKNLSAILDIDLSLENSPFHCLELSDVGNTITDLAVDFINLVKNKAERFILDITKDPANTITPTITFDPPVQNLPAGFPSADPRYLLEIVARETPTETRYEVVNRLSAGGAGATVPVGTADFQHLEWDNIGAKWDASIAMTFQNVTGIIKWKNAAGTEEVTLSVTGIDNFLWTDFTTGAPHTMTFSGLQLQGIGHLRSDNIPTPSSGFIQMGNTDSLDWRNAGNTNNASFEFNASDKFEFTDLAAGGILATIDGTELDLKIGSLLLTMANNRAIQFRNAADSEFGALSLSGSNNFTWVDPSTGSPHIMFFNGMLLQSIGELRSDNIPVPSLGFIKMGNDDELTWRNVGNTNNATFSFNGADKFEFTDLAAGGILATIDDTELDLKIGGLLLTMANNTAIQFRNAADTEFFALSVSASNNITWVDAATGAPHDMFMGFMNLKSVGFIESGSVPTSTGGFINMGNTEGIKWRNAANTFDAELRYSGADNLLFLINSVIEWELDTISMDIDAKFIQFDEITLPSNPPTNSGRLYIRDVATVETLFFLDSVGTETDLLAGGGGGANQQLSNLSGTVSVNLDLIPNQATGGNLGSGIATEEWFNLFTGRVQFPQFISPVITIPSIQWVDLATDEFRFNTPTGDIFGWWVGAVQEMELSNTTLKLEGVDLNMDIHNISNIGTTIAWNVAGQSITSNTSGLDITVPAGDFVKLTPGATMTAEFNNFFFRLKNISLTQTPQIILHMDDSAPLDGDPIGKFFFDGEDSVGTQTSYASIEGEILDTASPNESGIIKLTVASNGPLITAFEAHGQLGGSTPLIGFRGAAPQAVKSYSVTNPTTDRALNVTADSLAQVAQVLGTLLKDLSDMKIITGV